MTTSTTTRKIPNPLYAAAGAGDLAYEQLRKLLAQVAQLRARVEELRPAVTDTSLRADLDRVATAARRNAVSLLEGAQAGAQVAQDRAVAVYTELVNRGEKVVAGSRAAEAKIEIAPAAKTVTATAVVTPAADTTTGTTTVTPADIAPAVAPKAEVVYTTTTAPAEAAAAPAKKAAVAKKTTAAKK